MREWISVWETEEVSEWECLSGEFVSVCEWVNGLNNEWMSKCDWVSQCE